MHRAGRDHLLAGLRTRIERLEHGQTAFREVLSFGVPAIDQHLPKGGLTLGAVHEIMEAGTAGEHRASAALFVAGILSRLGGTVLWCLYRRNLFAPGLAGVSLNPERILFVETWRDRDVLPILEEGLQGSGLAAVVGEVGRVDLTSSRRLQLAAEKSGTTAFLIHRWRGTTDRAEPTAAFSRWRITPAPSAALPAPGVGRARWHVELLRCRGREPRSWLLESCDAKGRLALPSDLAHRPHSQTIQPRPAPRQTAGDGHPRRLAAGDRLR